MKNKKKFRKWIFIIIFIIIVGFAVWYIYHDLKGSKNELPTDYLLAKPGNSMPADNTAGTSTASKITSLSPEEIKNKMPDLDKEIVVKATDLSETEKANMISQIKDLTAKLKKDYDTLLEWLQLGIYRKNLGDYDGAREAWEFATLIRPNDPIAFQNLGDLYWQYSPDYPKAEKYFLKAIEVNPQLPFLYEKMYEFYRYSYKKPDLAESILVQGIKANPDDASLKAVLEEYRQEIKQ